MRPPHERATSSGWGATKTWVMAGRVYRARRAAGQLWEPAGTDQRDEDARAVRRLAPLVAVANDEGEDLQIALTDRDDQSTAIGELVAQFGRDGRCRRGHDDPVVWRAVRVAEAPVSESDLDPVVEPKRGQARGRLLGQVGVALQARHVRAKPGQDRRLVAGAGAEFQDPIAGSGCEQLGHPGDHPGLADGLAVLDRDRFVRVRLAPVPLVDEPLARDRTHRLEDSLIADAAATQLIADHPPALVEPARVPSTEHPLEDSPATWARTAAGASGRRALRVPGRDRGRPAPTQPGQVPS